MKIENKVIWQQAAGDAKRNYADLCLKWDVILNGPGEKGSWPKCKEALSEYAKPKKVTNIRTFCEDMKSGDLVVLRIGTNRVYGVGEIVGDYEHNDEFNDVDGWDIAHVRRVRWLWKYQHDPEFFSTHTLNFGDTTQKLNKSKSQEIIKWIESLDIPQAAFDHTPIELPGIKNRETNMEDIAEYLFDKGVASTSISTLLDEIDELVRIANWYSRTGQRSPSEYETTFHLVGPLLRSLGWTPQRMALEWNLPNGRRADLALFGRLPRDDRNVSVVVEVKKKNESCLTAFKQGGVYAKGLENCRRIIVTDGLRYGIGLFNSRNAQHAPALYAYLNLNRLRTEYPVYECKGAKEALFSMTPEWSPTDHL